MTIAPMQAIDIGRGRNILTAIHTRSLGEYNTFLGSSPGLPLITIPGNSASRIIGVTHE